MADRVLITGARAAAALDIARDFAAAGYEAHMADCAPARISRWSRAVAGFHPYPSPVRDRAGFRARVQHLAERLDPVLIVPACEEVFHLAGAGLGPHLFQPPADTLRRLHDKGAFADLASSLGLPVPETRAIEDSTDIDGLGADLSAWVFKARFSRFGQGTLVAPVRAALSRLGRGWIAQRRIEGQEASLYAVARKGQIRAFAAYGSAWRLPGGASLSFDPIEPALAHDLLAIAGALARELDLTGQFSLDLMVDREGRPWLLECNPRATSGVHLLARDGALAHAMLGLTDADAICSDQPRHLLPALLTFGLKDALTTRRIAAWRAQLRTGRDVAGRPGDRGPVAGALADGLGFMLSGALKGQSAAAASTADIEWNGEELP